MVQGSLGNLVCGAHLGMILSREGFCRNPSGIYLNKFPGEFCGESFVDSLGAFSPWRKKEAKKLHPIIHSKIQI